MNWKTLDQPTRLKVIGALILLLGLLSAALIYYQAAPDSGYGNEGDLLAMPQNTKIYRHDLELYGGKANVMMDEFNRWLWQAKTLAKLIAFFSIVTALAFFYVANHLEPRLDTDSSDENHKDEPH